MKVPTGALNEDQLNSLLTAAIAPRPIAWISSISTSGQVNLAPFSAFAPICNCPPLIAFSAGKKPNALRKDTMLNVLATGEFVINIVEEPVLHKMAETSVECSSDDERRFFGLTPVQSTIVTPPRIAECRVSMECRVFKHLALETVDVILGEILCFWIDDAIADSELSPSLDKGYAPMGALAIDYYVACNRPCIRKVVTIESTN